jgi:hypothetical protein
MSTLTAQIVTPMAEPIASGGDQPMDGLRTRAAEQGRVMNKLVRPVSAVALAAAIAGAVTIVSTFSGRVDASAPIVPAVAAAPVPVSGKCAEQAWPYIDADCLRDRRKAEGQAKAVARTVTADRKMAAQ